MEIKIWGIEPPALQQLPNGLIRVSFNVEHSTVENVVKDESGNEESEILDEYRCSTIDMEGPATYERIVEALIRDRYTVSDELAILRQRDDPEKQEEFSAYNDYAESC